MDDHRVRQQALIPLFGLNVHEILGFSIPSASFPQRLAARIYKNSKPVASGLNQISDDEHIEIPITPPQAALHFVPWPRERLADEPPPEIFPLKLLPSTFAEFDGLGEFAARSGPGPLGGFQTVTTISPPKVAPTLLILDFDQAFAEDASPAIGATNPYESVLVDSLLDAIRLVFGKDPHPYKAFHAVDGRIADALIKWPLTHPSVGVQLMFPRLQELKKVFRLVWHVRSYAREFESCRILTIALEYIYLSLALDEPRTNFLHLMIAFEALFKARSERSAAPACNRMAKLLATTDQQYNVVRRFMWNPGEEPIGCCQLRNEVVHGGHQFNRLPVDVLREFLRHALLHLIPPVVHGVISRHDYYSSLNEGIEKKYQEAVKPRAQDQK